MAEFCKECFIDHLHRSEDEVKRIILSNEPDLCEGCGQYKKVVTRIQMKRLFYCPECGKEQYQTNRSGQLYQNEATLSNLRGGYGRPIKHYKCECGNFLAGSMDLPGCGNEYSIEYSKSGMR